MNNFDKELASSHDHLASDNRLDLSIFLTKYLYHWPVVVTSLIITLTAAFFYLRYTKPIYEIGSTLLIKDEKSGGPTEDILSQLNMYGGSKVVENEIEILQSKTLMNSVVQRLGLDVSLRKEGRVIDSEIYKDRPIIVEVSQIKPEYVGSVLKISFPNANTFLLEDEKSGKKIHGWLDKRSNTQYGSFTIRRTPSFAKNDNKSMSLVFNDRVIVANDNLRNLSVTVPSKQSTILKLSYQSDVIEKGIEVVNTLIQVYNEASLADKNRTTQSTIEFIDERLALITGELTDVERDVEGFKSSQGLTDISNEAELFLQNVKANDERMNEVNLKLNVVDGLLNYVNSDALQEKIPSTLGIDDPVLLSQINQLSELQLQKLTLLSTTQPNNPIFETINSQISSLKVGIKTNLANIRSSLISTRSELNVFNSRYERSIKKIPGQERRFISIKRQQTIKESLYLYLLQKKEESALSYASAVADSRIVDTAYASIAPVKPKKAFTYAGALILSLLFPAFYILVKENLNNRVTDINQIAELTSTPVLAEVGFNEDSKQVVVSDDSRTAISEHFRALRTNLFFVQGKHKQNKGQVTLFTSSVSGEGKSFVATNLATAFAIGGQKTILLELDLRKPKLSRYLEMDKGVGFSNYLVGQSTISEIIKPSNIHKNLDFIGSGVLPPNPSELLIQGSMEELFEYLKENYSQIVIDSPPIGLVTDAQILSRLADVTIYIVRYGTTFKSDLKEIQRLLMSQKFPKLNLVFNGKKSGSSYGYNYGYYHDDSNEERSLRRFITKIRERF